MLSLVSVISVNLIASLVTPPVDSVRRLAMNASGGEVSVSGVAMAEGRAVTERRLIATASRYVGTRYRLGGTRPSAFDCSGFVRYVFARHGVALPRTAREQSAVGASIEVGLDSLEVGDLLFFRTNRGRAGHVAIYAGDGRIIHASAGSRRVRYDDIASPRGKWFVEHLTSVRRVVGWQSDVLQSKDGDPSLRSG